MNRPVLSCSLPVRNGPQRAAAFLRGVLPEGSHVRTIAHLAGIATNLGRVMTFTCLIGNADAHGRNVSLLHDTGGGSSWRSMTPFRRSCGPAGAQRRP